MNMATPRRRTATLLLVCVLAIGIGVSACGDGGDDSSSDAGGFGGQTPSTEPIGSTIPDSEFLDESEAADVEMDVADNTFEKDQLKVSAGTTVTFTNIGRNDHNIVSADGAFKTVEQVDFVSGDIVTLTFDKPGDYVYYCSIHGTPTAGQNGVIRVV